MVSFGTRLVASNVRRLMAHHRLTLVGLSQRSGVSKSLLGYLINYKDWSDRHPSLQTVEAIARAFGLQPWELMHPELKIGADRGSEVAPQRPSAKTGQTALDVHALSQSIEMALDIFRRGKVSPADRQLAEAVSYVYAQVTQNRLDKSAPRRLETIFTRHDADDGQMVAQRPEE